MISFDIETLGVESNAVILSAACVKFDLTDIERDKNLTLNERYQNYLRDSLFVKFDRFEQINNGRIAEKEALDWWKNQSELALQKSYWFTDTDLKIVEGIKIISEYCKGHTTFWARGGLDQILFDSLCRQFKQPTIAEYWDWLDFRTALNLTKNSVKRGYCDIPEFDFYKVVKHDPVHDAAYDVMMLLYGI